MNEQKHTPGPWTAYRCLEVAGGMTPWTVNAGKQPIAGINGAGLHVGLAAAEANAALIAKSPDLLRQRDALLAACEGILPLLNSELDAVANWQAEADAIRAAIAQVKETQP